MGKKVVVITSSFRNDSNTEALADAFIEGAEASANEVRKIELKDKNISFCRGCLTCVTAGRCVQEDDAAEIVEQMRNADVICFATPVYYFNMTGQLKTILDRAHPLWASEYQFRETYLLSASAADGDWVCETAVEGIKGWTACFKKAEFKGNVHAGGVNEVKEIEGHEAVKKAYEMGLDI